MNTNQRRLVLFILIGFVILAWAYGLVMPPFENLDEIEHFSAIRYVAEAAALPVHDPLLQERYHYRQEASQPPLYYILMGGLTRLLGLPAGDTNSYLVSNPFVACGPSDHPYNKHTLYHNPTRDEFPWSGALLTLHILRALAPLLQVVTVVGVYAIARLVWPQRPHVAPLAAALTAFNPQFLLVASGVNNDNLVTPLATLGLYLALLTRQRGLSLRRSIGLGVLAGLAALAKLSGLLLLGLVGLVLLEVAWRERHAALTKTIAHGLLVGTVAAAICGWWFWRNWRLYGDLTALEPMLELVGRRGSSIFPLNESGLMFRSFWGQIACAFFSDRFYLFFGLLTALGLAGLSWGLLRFVRSTQGEADAGRAGRESWAGMAWLALWFAIVFAGWLRWDFITPAPGGRLLFPAIGTTSTLLAYGLLRLWPAAWRGRVALASVGLLALIALATLRWELRPFFAPPRTYAGADAPGSADSLDATFGSGAPGEAAQIGLLGYAAEIHGAAPDLDVTLYWQASATISQDYALAIQLTSPIPGDDSLRFNYNTWPGRGNYPTTAWQPGRVIADHYLFRLPTSGVPTQAWQLLVALYEVESGERLSVRLYGQEVGRGLILTTLRVPGRPADCPGDAALAAPVSFGQAMALTGASVSSHFKGDPGIEVSLCWHSLATVPLDYTVFVHLYDENGELLATGDGPPMHGAFPTRLWQPGDLIADDHFISTWPPEKTDGYRVGVGWYDPATGERLPAVQAGQPLPNDVVLLDLQP